MAKHVEFSVDIGRYRFAADIQPDLQGPDRVRYFIGLAGDEMVRISREDFIALVQAGAGRG